MMEQIEYGSKTIQFQLEFSNRKSLGITVTPEQAVLVKAPIGAKIDVILERVRNKAPWILKQQSYFLSFHPLTPARRYVSGETHLYRGRQYRLTVEVAETESVKLKGRFIVVKTVDKKRVEKLVKDWYAGLARNTLHEIAKPLIEKFKKYQVEPTSIILREMPTRWGSCTAKGKIILNPELIRAPKPCIEYVIIHELCHLIYHDHTQKFLDLQTKEMPDWEKWKAKLESLLA